MKTKGKTLLQIVAGYISYQAIMTIVFIFVLPIFPAVLAGDSAFGDVFGCVILLGVYGVWYWRLRKKSHMCQMEQPQTRKMCLGKEVPEIFVITLGMGGFSSLWLWVVTQWLHKITFIGKSMDAMQKAMNEMENGNVLFAVLSIVIIGPIVEELLFRGILYQYFQRLSTNKLVPIAGTAILFGIWHGFFVQSVYTAVCGIVFAIVFYQTGSLKWTIGMHILNNLVSYLSGIPQLEEAMGYLDLLSIILIVPMVVLLIIREKRRREGIGERREYVSDGE